MPNQPGAPGVEGGNEMPAGTNTSGNSSGGREDGIISRTKTLAFPMGGVLPLENFEHKGDKPSGWQNSLAEMANLSGKALQESYRSGLSMSAEYHDKVADR